MPQAKFLQTNSIFLGEYWVEICRPGEGLNQIKCKTLSFPEPIPRKNTPPFGTAELGMGIALMVLFKLGEEAKYVFEDQNLRYLFCICGVLERRAAAHSIFQILSTKIVTSCNFRLVS